MNPALLTTHIAFIEGVGGPELMMIMFVVLLLFGGEKLPEFARGFGKAMREFRKAAGNVEDEFKRAIDDVERNATIDVHLDDKAAPRTAAPRRAYNTPELSNSSPPSHDDPNHSNTSPPQRANDAPRSTPN